MNSDHDNTHHDGPGNAANDPARQGSDALADDAALDALGLLDAADQESFEQALRGASPEVRSALLEIQAAWAVDPAFRSRSIPESSLRSSVLAAVRREMAATGVSGAEGILPATVSGDFANLQAPLQGLVDQIRAQQDRVVRSNKAPWLWRAASLTLAAGLVVSAWFQVRLSDRVAAIAELAMQQQTDGQLREMIGPGFERFQAGRTRVVGLAGTDATVDGAATLYLDPEVGDGFLLVLGLDRGSGPYTLRGVDGTASKTVLTFDPHDSSSGFRISKDRLGDPSGLRFEIADASGTVILRSA